MFSATANDCEITLAVYDLAGRDIALGEAIPDTVTLMVYVDGQPNPNAAPHLGEPVPRYRIFEVMQALRDQGIHLTVDFPPAMLPPAA